MNKKIVYSEKPVVLVGGGAVSDAILRRALQDAGVVVAADGGAARVLALGRMPDAVYGDMDSLGPAEQDRLAPGVLRRIAEQDSTDFDKALRHIEAPLVLGHGFLGARIDHQLSAMNVLARRADRRCVLIGAEDAVCLCPPRLLLDFAPGARVSLFPMAEVTGQSSGLRWPIDGLHFAPGGVVGTSNAALGSVTLAFDAPHMLLMVPAECLNALLAGLAGAPRWPSRA